ncbi:MAG: phosphoribosyltransferase family protein [Candidatus Berkelbacteria bacterium]|nr:phosphoribosyltransferase family protein [Candidatus Berkelbacteria bacterium]
MKREKTSGLFEETALAIFRDGGIEFGSFTLKSHTRWPDAPRSPIFVNLREQGSSEEHEGRLTAETVDIIGRLIVERHGRLVGRSHDYIIGIPRAGEPIVDAIMRHLPEWARVRRLHLEKEGTGSERRITLRKGETYPEGATVVLVDDLVTTADTKLEAVNVLCQAGMVANVCLVVVDRQQGGIEQARESLLSVIPIYRFDELLDLYQGRGLISADQVEEVRTYRERFDEYTSTHPPVEAA